MIKNLGRRKLSKTGSHRRGMFSQMATSLVLHEKIKTTLPKAKELRAFVEKAITDAKQGKRLRVRKFIKNRDAFNKVFDVIAARYKDRNGGYVKIVKIGPRKSDRAEMAFIKLVE